MEKKLKKLSFEDFGHKLDLEILLPIIRFRGTAEAAVYFAKLWPKVRQQTIALCGSNFHVTLGSSPQLYNLTQSVSDTLSIGDYKPQFYVEEGYHINSYTLKDLEDYYVVLTTGAVDRLTTEELKFLVGHELGHLIAGHVEYHLLLAYSPESVRFFLRVSEFSRSIGEKLVAYFTNNQTNNNNDPENGDNETSKTSEISQESYGFGSRMSKFTRSIGKKVSDYFNNDNEQPNQNNESQNDDKEVSTTSEIIDSASGLISLNKWNRISEYTADRVGLLACQDINVALSALMKISGLPQSYYGDASVEEFVKQANEFTERYGGNYDSLLKDLDVLDEDHPWLIRRAAELLDWYNSGEYEKLLAESDTNNLIDNG